MTRSDDAPREQQRAEVAERGRNSARCDAARGEQLALVDEVRGEEDDEQHLGDLAGLEVERADRRPTGGRR